VRDALDAGPGLGYGGIIAVDGTIDAAAAEHSGRLSLEIVAAPSFEPAALERLRRKKNLRLMRYRPGAPEKVAAELRVRSALGGVLAEDDDPQAPPDAGRSCRDRQPTEAEWRDIIFAWDIVRHVKSNGVVIVRDGRSRGICAARRTASARCRSRPSRARLPPRGAACASDGFFPFADGLEAAAAAGCSAVIAPRGSIRDADVTAAADRLGIALVFLELPATSCTDRMLQFFFRLIGYRAAARHRSRIAQTLWTANGLDQFASVQSLPTVV